MALLNHVVTLVSHIDNHLTKAPDPLSTLKVQCTILIYFGVVLLEIVIQILGSVGFLSTSDVLGYRRSLHHL